MLQSAHACEPVTVHSAACVVSVQPVPMTASKAHAVTSTLHSAEYEQPLCVTWCHCCLSVGV